MTPVVHTDIPRKEILSKKKGFLLVNLFKPSLNWSHQEAGVRVKNFLHSIIHFFEQFLNFSLQTCTQKSRQKNWDPYLVWTEALTYSYAYELHR